MEEKTHQGYVPAILDVGDTFVFETLAGRSGVGRVNWVNTQDYMRRNPYHVRWDDELGKHYEWFGLQEFKSFIRL